MEDSDAGGLKDLAFETLGLLRYGFKLEKILFGGIGFIDARTNDVGLATGFELRSDMLVDRLDLARGDDFCDDRLAAFWHFIKQRDVEVAVDGEREGARDGGRGHREKVRQTAVFLRQGAALARAETVLLVDDDVGQTLKFNSLIDKRVRADKDGYFATFNPS